MERLTEECHGFCRDLQSQEALVSQKEGVITELRDEAYTLWASRWLAFRRKVAKVFPGLDFNFQVLAEEAPAKAGSPTSVAGTSPSNLHGLEVRVTKAA